MGSRFDRQVFTIWLTRSSFDAAAGMVTQAAADCRGKEPEFQWVVRFS
jgi:hypothetical protein